MNLFSYIEYFVINLECKASAGKFSLVAPDCSDPLDYLQWGLLPTILWIWAILHFFLLSLLKKKIWDVKNVYSNPVSRLNMCLI